MPFDLNNTKYACRACVIGHRTKDCDHADRWQEQVRRPGRPLGGDACVCENYLFAFLKLARVPNPQEPGDYTWVPYHGQPVFPLGSGEHSREEFKSEAAYAPDLPSPPKPAGLQFTEEELRRIQDRCLSDFVAWRKEFVREYRERKSVEQAASGTGSRKSSPPAAVLPPPAPAPPPPPKVKRATKPRRPKLPSQPICSNPSGHEHSHHHNHHHHGSRQLADTSLLPLQQQQEQQQDDQAQRQIIEEQPATQQTPGPQQVKRPFVDQQPTRKRQLTEQESMPKKLVRQQSMQSSSIKPQIAQQQHQKQPFEQELDLSLDDILLQPLDELNWEFEDLQQYVPPQPDEHAHHHGFDLQPFDTQDPRHYGQWRELGNNSYMAQAEFPLPHVRLPQNRQQSQPEQQNQHQQSQQPQRQSPQQQPYQVQSTQPDLSLLAPDPLFDGGGEPFVYVDYAPMSSNNASRASSNPSEATAPDGWINSEWMMTAQTELYGEDVQASLL